MALVTTTIYGTSKTSWAIKTGKGISKHSSGHFISFFYFKKDILKFKESASNYASRLRVKKEHHDSCPHTVEKYIMGIMY